MLTDKKVLVLDIETERLNNPDKIWCICAEDLWTGEKYESRSLLFHHQNEIPWGDYDCFVAHNGINFDGRVLLNHGVISRETYNRFFDTLIVSRLLYYGQMGGHSLERWGAFFRYEKDLFDDFSQLSDELVSRCHRDVEINKKLVQYFLKYIEDPSWQTAINIEMKTAFLCEQRHQNGFNFNIDEATRLLEEVSAEVLALEDTLQRDFPPRSKLIREITPQATKAGTLHLKDFKWLKNGSDPLDLSPYSSGSTFSLIEYTSFNPRSSKQRIEILNAAGWKPIEKTKGFIAAEREARKYRMARKKLPGELQEKLENYETYGWKTSEVNLETLPPSAPPSAQRLKEFVVLANRESTLRSWIDEYNPVTRSIHGRINGIGAWTHRKSHLRPNMANIPRVKRNEDGEVVLGRDGFYASDFRKLWCVHDPDHIMVGTDADAIQLRVLAHYMEDDEFAHAVIQGEEHAGTDIHSINRDVLSEGLLAGGAGAITRDDSKRFIYAWLLGAGTGMVAHILRTDMQGARRAEENFLERFPKLAQLKQVLIPRWAQRGWFEGLDGRKIICRSSHLMLAGMLQGGESVIMKQADILWNDDLTSRRIPYKAVDDVHDEWQTTTPKDFAKEVGNTQCQALEEAGKMLNLNVAISGSSSYGRNWLETH